MRQFVWLTVCTALLAGCTVAKESIDERGVTITAGDGTKVRLEAVTDRIIRVSAAPHKLKESESLTILPQEQIPQFSVESSDASVTLRTAEMTATVERETGRVAIMRADGTIIVEENCREFIDNEVEGDRAYTIRQVFESPADEAFYGLGQHQSDEFNYKGRNETLYQYNTKVSVPFIVSSRNYGILWENYSLTRWGDPRDYSELNDVFEMEPLKATYTDADGRSITRSETCLDYADLDKVKNVPEEFIPKFYGSTITWEGDIKARESGTYRFILYYAGYTKVFIDDRDVVP